MAVEWIGGTGSLVQFGRVKEESYYFSHVITEVITPGGWRETAIAGRRRQGLVHQDAVGDKCVVA